MNKGCSFHMFSFLLGQNSVISKESTDQDVKEWLQQQIYLSENELIAFPAFNYLDGQTLFAYEDVYELSIDLQIPIGLSRKIFLHRQPNDKLTRLLQCDMAKWSVSEVQAFIRQSVTVPSPDIEEICYNIQEKRIDGIVFLSYDTSKEMQLDIQTKDNLGVLFKRIITKRDYILKSEGTDSNSPDLSPDVKSSMDASLPHKQQVQGIKLTKNISMTKQTEGMSKEWTSYIRNVLLLIPCEMGTFENQELQNCKLNLIHSDWKNRNALEKKIIFFVLSMEDDFPDDRSRSSLWDLIRKNLQLWHEHFTPTDKKSIKISPQREDALIMNEKTLLLSKGNVKMRYLLEKTLEELFCVDNVFLIISKNVLQKEATVFSTCAENPRKKNCTKLNFTFSPTHKYWIFDPDDYSYGFKLNQIQMHSHEAISEDEKKYEHESEDIKFIPQVDNTVNTAIEIDKANVVLDKHPTLHKIQTQRSFKSGASAIQYNEGWRISTPEHDGSVSFQCFEFKHVPESLIDKGSERVSTFMNKETICFACGCLNARKNGTIMFGIGDSYGKSDGPNTFVHGEVVGVEIGSIGGDFIANFTESLRIAIQKCFECHVRQTASRCIGNPVFVNVISNLPSSPKFVIEVDIEPSSSYCKDDFFRINRSNILTAKDIEKEFTLYVREDMGTAKKNKSEERVFIKTDLKEIVLKRADDEIQMRSLKIPEPIESPMDKLRKLMCKGSNKLDKSIWPILVLNKPTDEQKNNEQWFRWLKFIKLVDFHAVFDFDDESNYNGICSIHRNNENSILQDDEIFLEYSGNKLELATKLGMPHDMKTVWIFSNGRTDIIPGKPSYRGAAWTNTYSAGIRDAVIFYSQREIIPRGRALVIILLFSNNFDGLVETFREIDVRFGWEQIAIIANENTLTRFISECPDKEENIKKCGISGESMTWEHVNSTFLEITGYEDQGNIILTTSTGAFVAADEKFVETLTEFHILSAKQCEDKKFKSNEEEEEFSSEMEMQFYRGEKVEWFNFHFGTHVLERHCFHRLKTSVGKILQSTPPVNDRDRKIVSTVIIAHEPGAGGTTLSRNILWAFHKMYRCAIITKITERTAKNVMSLWQHKDQRKAKPLLLLIDELSQSDLTFEYLIRQIHIEYRSNSEQDSLICCFLVCQRENDISDQQLNEASRLSNSGHLIEHLKQKLTESEIRWMDTKYKKLEKKGAEYQPEYLLSFMILRKGFSQEYIKNTIKEFLTHINISANEFELLEYISLISTYAPTSRRGPNVFIPLECCDDLMGARIRKSAFWEKSMSSTLKMFLIIEQKETASGMQIRMAHPALAEAVLSQILENKKENLSSLTLRFLDCAILQSPSHGREMVVDFTKEMMVRRLKEEYNDDKTTSYSPLIEAICKQEESWENAKLVLKKGFEKIRDTYIAQTLARLCSKNKDFQTGISWAKQAVDMSIGNRTANGFCHHTLAIVLDELFNHETRRMRDVTPSDATEQLTVILDAVDHFIEASRLRIGNADHILYPITGVLNSILDCLKFIKNKVKFTSDVDIKKFITDESYSPDEIEDWIRLRPKFLRFSSEGEKAFAIIEECLCFNTTFYAHDRMSSFPTITREHRMYRNLQYRYPDLFNDFSSFFGSNADEPPQSNVPEVLNNWHRRCLLNLGGNSYMNICNILRRIRSRSERFNREDAIRKCLSIKTHLMQITDRTPKDLSNLVSVNIILGLLGGQKRDSLKTILDYCKQIIKFQRENVDIGYFFICLLLWPSSQINVEYDDTLFYESLRFLHRKKEIRQGRPRDNKYVFLKEEKNVTQPTPQFFLTNGRGFQSLCHRFDLFFREEAESQFDNAMWENFGDKYNLKRLKGFLKFNEGKSCIRLLNEKSTSIPHIEIRKIRTGKKEFLSDEDVYFYLGFSIAGPIAYNVKPTRHEDLSNQVHNPLVLDDKVEQYLEETVSDLQSKLTIINDLKGKLKNGRILKQRDVSFTYTCITNNKFTYSDKKNKCFA